MDDSTPRNPSLEHRMQQLSVTPRRDRREHPYSHPKRNQRSFHRQPRNRSNIHPRDEGRNSYLSADPSGIHNREIRREEDLRNILQNRRQQNSHVSTGRTLTVETRSFYRKIVRIF